MKKPFFFSVACVLFLALAGCARAQNVPGAAVAPGADERFEYSAPGGIVFTVTPAGLSQITKDGQLIANGNWQLNNYLESWFDGNAKPTVVPGYVNRPPQIVVSSLHRVDATHVRVSHVYAEAKADFDYAFAGEDVTITARVENTSPTGTLSLPAMGGLIFPQMQTKVAGGFTANVQPAHLDQAFYPGFENRIGASYLTTAAYGIGTAPGLMRDGDRSCTHWHASGDGAYYLHYAVLKPIAPGCIETMRMTLRVSANSDWKHLLEPYKKWYDATYGPQRYHADHRARIGSYLVSPGGTPPADSPYGLIAGRRADRTDANDGVEQYTQTLLKCAEAANAASVIMWGQTGENGFGQQYRTDADVIPPPVAANLPKIAARLHATGRELGATTRPSQYTTLFGNAELTLPSVTDATNTAIQVKRFLNLKKLGCTEFYIDSMGGDAADVPTLRALRDALGPDVETFVEHNTDAVLAQSGLYLETSYAGGTGANANFNIAWINPQIWEIYRYLRPDMSTFVMFRGDVSPGVTWEDIYRWHYAHHLSPALQEFSAVQSAAHQRPVQDEWVDAKGKWLK